MGIILSQNKLLYRIPHFNFIFKRMFIVFFNPDVSSFSYFINVESIISHSQIYD